MKKIFPGLLMVIIVTSIIINDAKAQISLASMSSSKDKTIPASASFNEDKTSADNSAVKSKKAILKEAKAVLKAQKANFKAAKSFKKNFEDGPDVKWYVESNAITASFNRDEIPTRVIYNKRGNWVHTISYLQESKMPRGMKSLIRSNYPDYNIKGMHEIKEGDITFCVVYLEDETSIKQISVYNGTLDVYKEFTKQQ